LADIQLPGIDGLEMTRRIKQDARSQDTLVVALTAFAMQGDEQRALDAGCDDYITKPIDTRALGARIRELLDRRAVPPPRIEESAQHETVPVAELQELRRRFLSEGQEGARRLLLELDGSFNVTDAARGAHQWIGTGGLLGFTAIARSARELETILHERPVDTAQVRESVTNLILAFMRPREARETAVPKTLLASLNGKRAAVVGLPAHEAQRLCVALEDTGAQAEFFELTSSPSMAELACCDLAVIFVHPAPADSAWLAPASAALLPTVFVGSRDDLLTLSPATRALAAEFLMDSWQPDEALVRLSLALTHERLRTHSLAGDRPRVLIAAEGAGVSALVSAALESFGIEFSHTSGGVAALQFAMGSDPNAAIVDVDREGSDGFELISALRKRNGDIPILLLAARQKEDDILRGVESGADDFLMKPFSPLELVTRLRLLVGQ
jgi:DNA-binding response OmpR family regulator